MHVARTGELRHSYRNFSWESKKGEGKVVPGLNYLRSTP
jgi:hypothetical protein